MVASQLPEITHALFVVGRPVNVDEDHNMRLPLHHDSIEIVTVEHLDDALSALLIQRFVHITERFHLLAQNGADELFHPFITQLSSQSTINHNCVISTWTNNRQTWKLN